MSPDWVQARPLQFQDAEHDEQWPQLRCVDVAKSKQRSHKSNVSSQLLGRGIQEAQQEENAQKELSHFWVASCEGGSEVGQVKQDPIDDIQWMLQPNLRQAWCY